MSRNAGVGSISLEMSNALASIGRVEANKLPCRGMCMVSLGSSAHEATCRESVSQESGNAQGSCKARAGNALESI